MFSGAPRRLHAGWRWLFAPGILLSVCSASHCDPARPFVPSEAFRGKCVVVFDGDTILVLRDGKPLKIRLEGIDAPESGFEFCDKAKQFTAGLAFGKVVEVRGKEYDQYGRLVARVLVGGQDVSVALVEAGLAWHYRKYSADPELARAEEHARARRSGVWSLPDPVPPWEAKAVEHRSFTGTDAERSGAADRGNRSKTLGDKRGAYSELSGTWTGTLSLTQIGACPAAGEPQQATMTWSVTDSGIVKIDEPETPAMWDAGAISPELNVRLSRTSTYRCSGRAFTSRAFFSGTIRKVGSAYRLEMEATETMCPPDCVFKVSYSMTKR